MTRPITYFAVLACVSMMTLACSSKSDQQGIAHTENALPEVTDSVMQQVYEEIKTPFKYGLVKVPPSNDLKMDCPSIFREGDKWYMTYLIYGGRGYETWLAESDDLLHWEDKGKVMSFSDTTDWDMNQKAAYIALQDKTWGGSYALGKYDDKYWMSYFGGNTRGYEAGVLSIGMAYTDQDPTVAHEWKRLEKPVLTPTEEAAQWWDNSTMYKNSVILDEEEFTGHPFIMYYNARGDSINPARGAERIAMAVSDDMKNWKRYGKEPLINHHKGISGDAYIQQMGDLYVMFYFGAFWPDREDVFAFNRFAVSNNLIDWVDWEGEDLISPSEPYDDLFAHKSFVVKHDGVVYHYYCAVNQDEQRGIAVATSQDLGTSELDFLPLDAE
ncbi:glycosylase [Echinicola sp. CAU 1574]|uniref:Glycosylase n=1 Tax=Echinicola arenosa TaxID=2774144 RepID=A0ABR9AMN1_9BACT|nr:glycosylase [Echinicola arenosa]MBD8489804.1 glycosylase [Echinicola arenosa]